MSETRSITGNGVRRTLDMWHETESDKESETGVNVLTQPIKKAYKRRM